MNLNVSEWKEFIVGKVFDCNTTILSIKDVLENGNIPFISRTAENNGCDGYVVVEEEAITKGQCLTIGAEGIYCFYQPKDFATGNKVYTLRNNELNFYQYIFVATILNKEDYKYSYGRARIKSKLENEVIKLPIQYNSDGSPLLDNTYKYSEQGYVPDWQFMEDYIKLLQYKPLTTKRVNEKKIELNVSQWKEFVIDKVFEISSGKGITKEELEENEGDFEAVQSGEENNGVIGKIDLEYCKSMDYVFTNKPCLTIARTGTAGFTSFHKNGCVVGDSAKILLVKNTSPTINQYLFLRTIFEADRFKYTYGRKVKTDKLRESIIKLPIQRDTDGSPVIDKEKKYHNKGYIPDWQFMENYINSLPYSDRII